MKKYLIIIEKTDTGYSAYVPDLPGCVATGKTKDDDLQQLNLSCYVDSAKSEKVLLTLIFLLDYSHSLTLAFRFT